MAEESHQQGPWVNYQRRDGFTVAPLLFAMLAAGLLTAGCRTGRTDNCRNGITGSQRQHAGGRAA